MGIRVRVAIALAGCLLVAGAVVLAVSALTYQRAVYQTPTQQTDELLARLGSSRAEAEAYVRAHPEVVFGWDSDVPVRPGGLSVNEAFRGAQRAGQEQAIARSRLWSVLALGVMAVAAAVIGWLIAGRIVRPLQAIADRARAASDGDLSSRIDLGGPEDEIHDLAETFDQMLDRLERSFVAQRQFSVQLSHELRTPLAIIASETELMLADPTSVREESLRHVRDATVRAERIITALLALARTGSGDLQPETVHLDQLVGDALGEMIHESTWRDLRVDLEVEVSPVNADRALLERMIENVLSNAARHNRRGGWVRVGVRPDRDEAVFAVENSRPVGVPAAGADRPPSSVDSSSHGIGLTVVEAVVAAHAGTLSWSAPTGESSRLEIRLPLAPVPVGQHVVATGRHRDGEEIEWGTR